MDVVEKTIRDLSAAQVGVRERAADDVIDVHRGVSIEQVVEAVRALVRAVVREENAPAAQEAQLNALLELRTWHEFDARLLEPLRAVRGQLPSGYADYLDDLRSERK